MENLIATGFFVVIASIIVLIIFLIMEKPIKRVAMVTAISFGLVFMASPKSAWSFFSMIGFGGGVGLIGLFASLTVLTILLNNLAKEKETIGDKPQVVKEDMTNEKDIEEEKEQEKNYETRSVFDLFQILMQIESLRVTMIFVAASFLIFVINFLRIDYHPPLSIVGLFGLIAGVVAFIDALKNITKTLEIEDDKEQDYNYELKSVANLLQMLITNKKIRSIIILIAASFVLLIMGFLIVDQKSNFTVFGFFGVIAGLLLLFYFGFNREKQQQPITIENVKILLIVSFVFFIIGVTMPEVIKEGDTRQEVAVGSEETEEVTETEHEQTDNSDEFEHGEIEKDTKEEVLFDEETKAVAESEAKSREEAQERAEAEAKEEEKKLTTKEQNYVNFVGQHSIRSTNALTKLGANLEKFDFSDEEMMNIALSINEVQTLSIEYFDYMNVPKLFEEVDKYYFQAMLCFDDAMYYLVQGIDNHNNQDIKDASKLMEEGRVFVGKATKAMEKVIDDLS